MTPPTEEAGRLPFPVDDPHNEPTRTPAGGGSARPSAAEPGRTQPSSDWQAASTIFPPDSPSLPSGATLRAPGSFPGYLLEEELGHGAMGFVYKAHQPALNRSVALKVIATHVDNEVQRQRFRRETEAVARLQHPNIVQIYEVGENDGAPWFAMEFCSGGSLRRQMGEPHPADWSARLVATLARAVQHTHDHQILHRDLKPGNILLTEDGTVKLADFGLARMIDQTLLTATREVLGTPCYMSPEQAEPGEQEVSPAADIYALGAILYEALTGRPPFKGATTADTIHQLIYADPVSPRHLVPKVPRDLETICLKCLQKKPQRRYRSAGELADDLESWLAGKPIKARPMGRLERLGKWVSRHRLAAAVLGLMIVTDLAGVLAATLAWRRAEAGWEQAVEESEQRRRKSAAEQQARIDRQLYLGRIALADRELREGNAKSPRWARHQLKRCNPAQRGWEWHYLDRRLRGQEPRSWQAERGNLSSVAFNRDGTVLASGGVSGVVRLWRPEDGKLLRELPGHRGPINHICFSPDGKQIASAGQDRTVLVHDTGSGKIVHTLTAGDQPFMAVAYHPLSGGALAGATFDRRNPGRVWLWDLATGKVAGSYRGHESRITALSWRPDGSRLLSCGHDHTVRILDAETLQEVLVFERHAFPVAVAVFSPDSKQIASAAGRSEAEEPEEGQVLIWQAQTGDVLNKLVGHTRRTMALAFSNDGALLVSAGWDGAVKLWDVLTGQEVLRLEVQSEGIMGVAFSTNGRLAAGGIGGRITLWEGGQ
jgi:predicted Ser/Thr protein kinase